MGKKIILKESELISLIERVIKEQKGRLLETTVGCAKTDEGCVRKGSYTHTDEDGKKKTYPWHILNNKKDGIWRGCSSRENCEKQLAAIHA